MTSFTSPEEDSNEEKLKKLVKDLGGEKNFENLRKKHFEKIKDDNLVKEVTLLKKRLEELEDVVYGI